MVFHHSFIVHAPFAQVAEFHHQPASLRTITPPPLRVEFRHVPPPFQDGVQLAFTLWFGPLPLHWLAQFEQITPISFVDRQVAGPFARWQHLHTFWPIDEQTTRVIDRIDALVQPTGWQRWIGWAMWRGLPTLFAYRAWATRRALAPL